MTPDAAREAEIARLTQERDAIQRKAEADWKTAAEEIARLTQERDMLAQVAAFNKQEAETHHDRARQATAEIVRLRSALQEIARSMRAAQPYKSHDLGFADSISSNRVEEWADEIDEALAGRPKQP